MSDEPDPAPEAPQTTASPEAGAPAVAPAGAQMLVEEEHEGDDSDPWFRDEHRTHVFDSEAPDPPGLVDPLAPRIIAAAREILAYLLGAFSGPATLALQGPIWQWRKFELLDMLRPIEQLLRRFLLIEAFTPAGSQTLPRSAQRIRPRVKRERRYIELDPAHPETWPARFRVTPPKPFTGKRSKRRKLPHIDRDHFPGDPRTPLRFRRVLHDAWPLARRLEAVIRVLGNPAPFIRRLAFRVARGPAACPSIDALAVYKPKGKPPLCHDANVAAAARLDEMIRQHWSSG